MIHSKTHIRQKNELTKVPSYKDSGGGYKNMQKWRQYSTTMTSFKKGCVVVVGIGKQTSKTLGGNKHPCNGRVSSLFDESLKLQYSAVTFSVGYKLLKM